MESIQNWVIKDLEKVHMNDMRATKVVPGNYKERLQRLKLPTLRFRRIRGDMIEVYL